MTLVVLGWDALDAELIAEFGLVDAFGGTMRAVDTFDNPTLGKPHTYEVWPSIVTGLAPSETGIRAMADDGGDWDDPVVDAVTDIVSGLLPSKHRSAIGRVLTNLGVERDYKDESYYAERGIETLFDGRRSLPLAVPNYRTASDEQLGLAFDRGARLSAYLTVEDGDDGEFHEPTVPIHRLEQVVAGQAGQKLGIVRQAIQREYDLVFAWLGYLDTLGHVAPVVAESGFQRRHYEQAANWTAEVATALGEGDRLVCLSDHGLRAGEHTHAATAVAEDPTVLEGVESVLDLKAALDAAAPARDPVDTPRVTERHRYDGAAGDRSAADVREQLSDLGYL